MASRPMSASRCARIIALHMFACAHVDVIMEDLEGEMEVAEAWVLDQPPEAVLARVAITEAARRDEQSDQRDPQKGDERMDEAQLAAGSTHCSPHSWGADTSPSGGRGVAIL